MDPDDQNDPNNQGGANGPTNPVSVSIASDNEEIILPDSFNGRDRYLTIEKLTPETISPLVKRDLSVESVIEIVDRSFSYPMTAHAGLKFDSRTFSSPPKREYDVKMKKVKIPSNYYPLGGNGLDRRYVYANPDYDGNPNDLDVVFMVDQNMDFATRSLLKRNLKDMIAKIISGYKYVRFSIWETKASGSYKINESTGDTVSYFGAYLGDETFTEVETPDSVGANQTNLYKKLFDALSSSPISVAAENIAETIIANFFLRKSQFSISDQVGKASESNVTKRLWTNTVRKVVYFSGTVPEVMSPETYDTLLSHARENCINFYYLHSDSDFSGTRTLRELSEDTGGGKFCMIHDSDSKLSQFCDSNFYDSNKIYYGNWDGTFKIGWTDNPAWILYDIITDPNYGLGNYIDSSSVDKWNLYDIGRYCDAVDDDGRFKGVPDGQGGLEPRYTCNIIFYNKDQAYNILKDIAAIFKGIVFWNTEGFSFFVDRPKEQLMNFSNSSVKDGVFNYTETARNMRYTSVEVTYNDRYDSYKTKIEYIEDTDGIRKYGLNPFKINAAGCTSRSEAKRIGRYVISTSIFEVDTVSFVGGLEAAYLQPGDLFTVSDEIRNVARTFGRILEVDANASTIKVDGEFKDGLDSGIYVHIPSGNYAVSDLNALTGADGGFTGTLEQIRARRQTQVKKLNISGYNNAGYGSVITVTGEFLLKSAIIDIDTIEGRISGATTTGETILSGIPYQFPANTVASGNPRWDSLTFSNISGVFSSLEVDLDTVGDATYGQVVGSVATWTGVVSYGIGTASAVTVNNSSVATASSEIRAVRLSSAGALITGSAISSLNDLWSNAVFTGASNGDVVIVFSNGSQISNSFSPSSTWNTYAATEVFKIGRSHNGSSSAFGYCAALIKGGTRILERASKTLNDIGSIKFIYRDLLAMSKLPPYYTIIQADVGNQQQSSFSAWKTGTTYKRGAYVQVDSKPYYAKVDHVSSASFTNDYLSASPTFSKWSLGSNLGYSTVGFPKDFFGGTKVAVSETLTTAHVVNAFNSIGIEMYQGPGPLGQTDLRNLAEIDGIGYSGLVYGTGYPVGFYNLDLSTSPQNLSSLEPGSLYVLSGSGVEPKFYKTIATKEEEANLYGIVGLEYHPNKEDYVEREIDDTSSTIYVKSPYDIILKPEEPTNLLYNGVHGGTGISLSWTATTTDLADFTGYKIYVSRPDYSTEHNSALTEFYFVPKTTLSTGIPINDIYGQYDIDVYAQGKAPYKFLSNSAASKTFHVLPTPTLVVNNNGSHTVDRLLVTGMKVDTADIKSLGYNVIWYPREDDPAEPEELVGYGQGNFTSSDVTFRWKYIDPTGGVISTVEKMRNNPFVSFPPKVKVEVLDQGGNVLDSVENYQGLSYRIDQDTNKRLTSRETVNYKNVVPTRNLSLRVTVEGVNGLDSYGRFNSFNVLPEYSKIDVIDSFQDSPYYVLSGFFGNTDGVKLAVWNSGNDNIVTGSGIRGSDSLLIRSETGEIAYENIVEAFKSADGFNGVVEGSVRTVLAAPAGNGITINYRGSDPDYTAYVNYYEDLVKYYDDNIAQTNKSKEVWGQEHYSEYGLNEGRELLKLNDGTFGDADLNLVPNNKIGFSGLSITVFPEAVSYNELVFNCYSPTSNKDVYKVDIYSGDTVGFTPDTTDFTNLHKEQGLNETRAYSNTIRLSSSTIERKKWYYFKFQPYDDFGKGAMSPVVSGYLEDKADKAPVAKPVELRLNGGADQNDVIPVNQIASTPAAQASNKGLKFKIVTFGVNVNWTTLGAPAEYVIGTEFRYSGENYSGTTAGTVKRVEEIVALTDAETNGLLNMKAQTKSTVTVPEDIEEGSSYNMMNNGKEDIYIKTSSAAGSAGGKTITILKPGERTEIMRVGEEWIDSRGDNLYLD